MFKKEDIFDIQSELMSEAKEMFEKNGIAGTLDDYNTFIKQIWGIWKESDFEFVKSQVIDLNDYEKIELYFADINVNEEYIVNAVEAAPSKAQNERVIILEKDNLNEWVRFEIATGRHKGEKLSYNLGTIFKPVKEYEGFRVRDKVKIKGGNEVYITDIDLNNKVIRVSSSEIPFEKVHEKLTLVKA